MDEVSAKVRQMYDQFPYPSPRAHGRDLRELLNLLTLFSMETKYDFRNRAVLDAGTGTGHRLIKAAARLRQTRFTAIDISEKPLSIARQVCREEGLDNIEFEVANLMEDVRLGEFDAILCMGVLHHLVSPARGLRNLVQNLADDGLIFLYVYGRHGCQERMRRKQIVSILNGNEPDFHRGISLVKELGFDNFEYGWNLNFEDDASRDALIVDAYLNVNETLFDFDELSALLKDSGLAGFMTYGLTLNDKGVLFDTRIAGNLLGQATNVASFLPTPLLRQSYERLDLADKCRLMDLWFKPNGYTVVGFKNPSCIPFESVERFAANAIWFDRI